MKKNKDDIKVLKTDLTKDEEKVYFKVKAEISEAYKGATQALNDLIDNVDNVTKIYQMFKRLNESHLLVNETEEKYAKSIIDTYEKKYTKDFLKEIQQQKEKLCKSIAGIKYVKDTYFTEKVEGDYAIVSDEAKIYTKILGLIEVGE